MDGMWLHVVVWFRLAPNTPSTTFQNVENFAFIGRLHSIQYGNTKCFSGETSQNSSLLHRRTYLANCFAIYWFYSHVYTSREIERKNKISEMAYDEICVNRSTGWTVSRLDACMFPFLVTAGLTFGQICVIILVSPANFAFIVNAVECDFHFGASQNWRAASARKISSARKRVRLHCSKRRHNNNNETDSIISIFSKSFFPIMIAAVIKFTLSPNDGIVQRSGFCVWVCCFLKWVVVLHRFSCRRPLWFPYWWHIYAI